LVAVRGAVERLAAEGEKPPELRPAHPLVAALWLSIVRLAREWRERRRQGEAELADVRAVLDGLPQPLLLLDERRRIARANAAAGAVFGGEIVGHDLAVALRQPSLLDAADGVLAG